MQYYSLNNHDHKVSFREAVVSGLAPDKGLYFPVSIPKLEKDFVERLDEYDPLYIARKVISPFIEDEIPRNALQQIIDDTLSFPFPVREVEQGIYSLELYHGPTLAFKDVGAKFMAGCLGYFRKDDNRPVTVLAATSGDTGAAVAHGFYNVPGVRVVILYPSGKVSKVQEQQLTTLGGNVTAIEVEGTFDDCQRLVKTAFNDTSLKVSCLLTSANSINVARWLPQMFYYFMAYRKLKQWHKDIVFSVPSGNFGNICAGMMAAQMGLPIQHFIASTNINDTVPRFMQSGNYDPQPAQPTISNAMDVADPSNFVRILELFAHREKALNVHLSSYSFDDRETLSAIESVYKKSKYLMDPHGAVGYLGLKKYLAKHPQQVGVFLETAHPVKFIDSMPGTVQDDIDYPARLKQALGKEKKSLYMQGDYIMFKNWLTGQSYAV
ncbi:threonine synthase [Chitinophaga caeni]|uniref:Threonine synthase n=1 Tax=Chitinophaga caeni TaxID=2029983 RepID=A0A291QX48_9BACT|nr:threonine synthase [Chitinophaga caeni]ATL48510.1 threonine synthase [Chitinophaga caeni]